MNTSRCLRFIRLHTTFPCRMKGEELVGLKYKPLFDYFAEVSNRAEHFGRIVVFPR